MAVAIYTSDLTALIPDDAVSTGNWAALGGGASGLNIETDYFIQGVNCLSKNAFANATKGMVEDTTATALTTGDLSAVYTWITHTTPGSLDTKANGGISIVMGSASNAINTYNYAGSDTIDYGAPWICAVVDPENATASTGTISHTAMDTYGGQAKLVGGPTKGAPLGIDAIRQGRSYEVTAGDSGTPATFTGAAAKNDLQANRYGQLQGVPGISGSYTMQCHFSIGTAATAAYFKDSNFNISLNDLEFVDPAFQAFEVVNAGSTCIWNNGTISAVGTNSKGSFNAVSSLLIDHTGMTFNDMGTFTYDSNSVMPGAKFVRCGLVTQNGATLTNVTFTESPNSVSLLVDDLALVSGGTFVSDGSNHAVDLGTIAATTSVTWNNTLSGYAVVNGATGNEAVLVSVASGQTLTINVSGGSTPTYNNVGTGTVVVNAAVDVTLTGLVAGTEIHAYTGVQGAAAVEIGTGTESSGTSYTFSQSVGGTNGFITLIKAGYKFLVINMTPYSSSVQSIPVQQTQDRGYDNPP